MKKGIMVLLACFVGILAMAFWGVNQGSTNGEECHDVTISGGGDIDQGVVYLEPETAEVEKEGCVVWRNQFGTQAARDEVALIVEDPKKCMDISGTSAEVYVGSGGKVIPIVPEDCNVTYWIPYGETSGLRFLERGTYEYEIRANDGVTTKGKVVVR